jgi:hypothetical protein
MAWVKVPSEHHPVFLAALPKDPRVETLKMFGGLAAKVNGNLFAGLFGHSTMIWLPEPHRARALALEGASLFDPMGDGRARSDKVMLPESMMKNPAELRRWLARAFEAATELPAKAAKPSARKPHRRNLFRPTARRTENESNFGARRPRRGQRGQQPWFQRAGNSFDLKLSLEAVLRAARLASLEQSA